MAESVHDEAITDRHAEKAGDDQQVATCQRLFAQGKCYASVRALQLDVTDWATRCGFSVELASDAMRRGLYRIQCCNKAAAVKGTPNSTLGCTFAIAFQEPTRPEELLALAGLVTITGQSVYRHSCYMAATTRIDDQRRHKWIELEQPKEFSRLLYTNPVCFLCTHNPPPRDDSTSSSAHQNETAVLEHNVMILSWLTATNNEGALMFSLNKHRHSASVLHDEFTLSVPVQGMEDLVRHVGGVSGKWNISKFPQDHRRHEQPQDSFPEQPSPRAIQKRKKRKGPKFPAGIPKLVRTSLGQGKDNHEVGSSWPFVIQGTVAHLLCQVRHIANEADWTDDDHLVVFAQVQRAWVHSAYWDASKKLFQPTPGYPPYLTFFGSQTLGYVSPHGLPTSVKIFPDSSS